MLLQKRLFGQSLVILFLHTWDDLKWKQRFKNQKKFKPLHCTGIHITVPTNRSLEIHSFKGEGRLPLGCLPSRGNQQGYYHGYAIHTGMHYQLVDPLPSQSLHHWSHAGCCSSSILHLQDGTWWKKKSSHLFYFKLKRKSMIWAKFVISFCFVEQFIDTYLPRQLLKRRFIVAFKMPFKALKKWSQIVFPCLYKFNTLWNTSVFILNQLKPNRSFLQTETTA